MAFDPKTPYKVPALSIPDLINIQDNISNELMNARVEIAKISGFLSGLPGTQFALMNPIFLKEAVESSEIENINTTLLEVLQRQVAPNPQEKTNSQLVVNYLAAGLWGMNNVKRIGMSTRLIQGLQSRLLPEGSGSYRRVPVVIGDGRGKVHYTPPNASDIPSLLKVWENLVNNNQKVDPLVLAAAAHYQFEAIHPFEDGNGRTGRMLMTLHLFEADLIGAPVIHISQYINAKKAKYYKLLREVSSDNNLEAFVQFIVKGFATQSTHSFELLQRIQHLQSDYQETLKKEQPTIYKHELVEAIFTKAVQTPVQLAKDIDVHYVTASKYLKSLADLGLLRVKKSGKYTYFINHKLLELIEQKSPMEIKKEIEG